jgi:hypothetical protein
MDEAFDDTASKYSLDHDLFYTERFDMMHESRVSLALYFKNEVFQGKVAIDRA